MNPDADWRNVKDPIRVGVSRCLLGEEVRFDGGHKRDTFTDVELGKFVEWIKVCPEVEAGMSIPRPAIHVLQPAGTEGEDEQRLVEVKSGQDHTKIMQKYVRTRLKSLELEGLVGFVLKKDSPSCGMERVKIHFKESQPRREGRGFFARALADKWPLLPIEEEGRLHDPQIRENFVERMFAYQRLRVLMEGRLKIADLVEFHTAHKLQLLAHHEKHYRVMGRLVADAKKIPIPELKIQYGELFMQTLKHRATRNRHKNVLDHMLGHFRGKLEDGARQEISELINDYAREWVPLVVPITLIRHHARRLGVDYLNGQLYLEPHPKELMLRNRI